MEWGSYRANGLKLLHPTALALDLAAHQSLQRQVGTIPFNGHIGLVIGHRDLSHLVAGDTGVAGEGARDIAGSDWDPLASLLFCGPVKANHTIINGRSVVEDGQLVTMDMGHMLEQHRSMAHHLMQASGHIG